MITPETIVSGIVCKKCNNELPPHTSGHHLDILHPIHKCPHTYEMDQERRDILLNSIIKHEDKIQLLMRHIDIYTANGVMTPKLYKSIIVCIHWNRRHIQDNQIDVGILPVNTRLMGMKPRFKNGIYIS